MISFLRNILTTIALGCGIIGIGSLALLIFGAEKYLFDLLILSSAFTIIIVISFVIFHKGLSKAPQSSFLYSIISIGVKFLLEMILAIFWFISAKKSSIEFVLIFFVLFLAFTLYLISAILKALKKKSLQK